MNEQIFFGWENVKEMCSDFQIDESSLADCKIIVAEYNAGSYEGDAYVLFERDGKLYTVSAGHCSCYGLEGQWDPEETTKEAIKHILENGNYFAHTANLKKSIVRYVTG